MDPDSQLFGELITDSLSALELAMMVRKKFRIDLPREPEQFMMLATPTLMSEFIMNQMVKR